MALSGDRRDGSRRCGGNSLPARAQRSTRQGSSTQQQDFGTARQVRQSLRRRGKRFRRRGDRARANTSQTDPCPQPPGKQTRQKSTKEARQHPTLNFTQRRKENLL